MKFMSDISTSWRSATRPPVHSSSHRRPLPLSTIGLSVCGMHKSWSLSWVESSWVWVNDFKSKKTLKFCLHKLNESNLIQFVCAHVCESLYMYMYMCVWVDCMQQQQQQKQQQQQQQIVYHSSLPYIIKRLALRVTLTNTANTWAYLCLSISHSLTLVSAMAIDHFALFLSFPTDNRSIGPQ